MKIPKEITIMSLESESAPIRVRVARSWCQNSRRKFQLKLSFDIQTKPSYSSVQTSKIFLTLRNRVQIFSTKPFSVVRLSMPTTKTTGDLKIKKPHNWMGSFFISLRRCPRRHSIFLRCFFDVVINWVELIRLREKRVNFNYLPWRLIK